MPLLPAPEGGADGVCLSTDFSPSLHSFAMSCPRAPASRGDPERRWGHAWDGRAPWASTCRPWFPGRGRPSRWGALRAMDGPAGAIVAGYGVTASSGARRSVARSPRSPGAPPCTRSLTILGCACADRCSRGSWSRWRACSVVATRPHAPRRSLRSAVGRAVFYCGLCAAPLGSDFLHAPCRLLRRFSSSWEARKVIPPGLRQGLGACALPMARHGSPP